MLIVLILYDETWLQNLQFYYIKLEAKLKTACVYLFKQVFILFSTRRCSLPSCCCSCCLLFFCLFFVFLSLLFTEPKLPEGIILSIKNYQPSEIENFLLNLALHLITIELTFPPTKNVSWPVKCLSDILRSILLLLFKVLLEYLQGTNLMKFPWIYSMKILKYFSLISMSHLLKTYHPYSKRVVLTRVCSSAFADSPGLL